MTITTIKVSEETKAWLDLFRESIGESYDEILMRKIIPIAKLASKNPEESQTLMKQIESRRKRITKGNFYGKEVLKKKFNIPEPQ